MLQSFFIPDYRVELLDAIHSILNGNKQNAAGIWLNLKMKLDKFREDRNGGFAYKYHSDCELLKSSLSYGEFEQILDESLDLIDACISGIIDEVDDELTLIADKIIRTGSRPFDTCIFSSANKSLLIADAIFRSHKMGAKDTSVLDYTVIQYLHTWSSTSLGFRGLGGASITNALTDIIMFERSTVVCFGGKFAYFIKNPNETFWDDVIQKNLVSVPLYESRYE